jgi:hypothetical protein
MTETFSFTATIQSSWDLVKKHLKFLLLSTIASAVILIVLQELQNITEGREILSIFAMILSTVVGIAVSLGWAQVILKLIRHGKTTWSDFQTDTKIWVHYFLARIMYGIVSLISVTIAAVPVFMLIFLSIYNVPFLIIGSIAFILGLSLFAWLLTRYIFVSFVAIDHPNLNGWKLLKESAKVTKGNMWRLFGFLLMITLINVIGLLFLIVGLIITVPVTMIATAYVYDHLKKVKHAE